MKKKYTTKFTTHFKKNQNIMKTTMQKREEILNYFMERTHKLERNAHNANTSGRSNLYLKLAISNRKRTSEIADVINKDYSEGYYNKLYNDIFEEESITS